MDASRSQSSLIGSLCQILSGSGQLQRVDHQAGQRRTAARACMDFLLPYWYQVGSDIDHWAAVWAERLVRPWQQLSGSLLEGAGG